MTTLYRWQFTTTAPLSIGDGAGSLVVDSPVATDGWQQVYVPTTSVVGSLRSHVQRECEEGADEWFGQREEPSPSALRFLGTRVISQPSRSRVSSTAINAHSGAAEAKTLRTTESIEPGLTVRLYAEVPDRPGRTVEIALSTWRPALGGSQTSGYGATTLDSFASKSFDLTTLEGLTQLLAVRSPEDIDAVVELHELGESVRSRPLLSQRFTIENALHIGGGTEDKVTVVHRRAGNVYVEGSSLKGVLRSRCRYIERSLNGGAGEPYTDELFGGIEKRGKVQLMGANVVNASLVDQAHNSVDRFTGGVLPGALWSEQVVSAGTFDLTANVLDERPSEAAVALLAASVRDLCDGVIGLGAKTGRGLGTLRPVGELHPLVADALPIDPALVAVLQADVDQANGGGND